MVEIFRALGDPHRLAIIRAALIRECHVQSLADELGITQPAVSRHVRLLRAAGLLDIERRGRRSVLVCPPATPKPLVVKALAWIAEADSSAARPPVFRDEPNHRSQVGSRSAPARDDIEDFLL